MTKPASRFQTSITIPKLRSEGWFAFQAISDTASTREYGLSVGLIWWCVGMLLATGYFTYLYRSFQGKVSLEGPSDYHG